MEPKASSTPVLRGIRARRPIHESDVESPIQNNQNSKQTSSDIHKESDSDENVEELARTPEPELSSEEFKIDRPDCPLIPLVIIGTIGIVFIAVLFLQPKINYSGNSLNALKNISTEFPEQVDDFWRSIDVSINEINRLERPKSIVFLYERNSYDSLKYLLKQISHYASCKLTSCGTKPIQLKPDYFNTPDILQDYGKIIHNNHEQLRDSGVMIVEHLEKISGKSAQAFHSLCDEENFVVGKALFLFTMEVEEMPDVKVAIRYLEKRLKVLWDDMRSENFQPLITRMTSFVLTFNGRNR